MQQTDQEYRKLLTEVIKKQIVILGPAITLAKARNVKSLTISEDGTVTAISGSPQESIRDLIDQFMELSGLIVKKSMEPILASYPSLMPSMQPSQAQPNSTPPTPSTTTPNNNTTQPAPLQGQDKPINNTQSNVSFNH